MNKRFLSRRLPRSSERGVILLLACFSMPVLVGLLGLGVDLSVMYSIKARLQMACDGASVAALRSLSLGLDMASQHATAQTIAQQWFEANFDGAYLGAGGTSAPTVTVTEAAASRTVSVAATTLAPTYFMKYFGRGATPVGAVGATSRRDVAIILVLDRSGSMAPVGGPSSSPCDQMKAAAKQFTGMFQQGRDTIGLVTFGSTVQIVQSPTTSFQTALGYTNTSGSSTGALDGISCIGGTNTPSAESLAWNELYKLQAPGALNIMVVFTDGYPTAGTFDFRNSLTGGSGCVPGKNWISATGEGNVGATVALGANSYWTPFNGMIGGYYADAGTFKAGVEHFFAPTGTDPTAYEVPGTAQKTASEAMGCAFPTNGGYGDPTADIAYIPAQDIFGNSGSGGYITTGISTAGGGFAIDQVTMSNVITNLTDSAANFARSPHIYSNGSAMSGVLVNTIGLGSNGGVDTTLLQRMANDQAYAGYNPSQPVGQFIYAPDPSQLQTAFLKLGSQILRISR